MKTYTISVTWGRSCTYHPFSTPKIMWDGALNVQGGTVNYLDRLNYKFIVWSQAHEVISPIYNAAWPGALRTVGSAMSWKSDVTPGDPGSMEGLRFELEGDEETIINLDMTPVKVRFRLGELLRRDYLRYRVGNKFAGNLVNVFLGKDARKRLSREHHLRTLDESGLSGYLVMPDDFEAAPKNYYHSAYGAEIKPLTSVSAQFPIRNFRPAADGFCPVRVQLLCMLGYIPRQAAERIDFAVSVGGFTKNISWLFTNRAGMPKMEDIYLDVPYNELTAEDNRITISYLSGTKSLLLHRIFVGTGRSSLAGRVPSMPPVPEKRSLHIGLESDMLTPENGEVDALIDILHDEQLGDYVLFRERGGVGTEEQMARWCQKVVKYDFLCGACGVPDEAIRRYEALLGERFLGGHAHEISNLAYGWGTPDPMDIRGKRTLPECKETYLKRMNARMVGQAVPLQHMDYEAGVETVITEIPGAHCSLMLSGARGAAKAFDKKLWGVHVANHVQKIPLDEDNVRRLFIVTAESWLFGARIIYDEEVAFRYNHDTAYAYSEELPTAYRRIYQSLYHYGNAIELGREIVHTGFLHGNYDLLIGGCVAGPYIERPKFWGKFGPESEGWDFDTPESGWKLIDCFLPGAHLNPVPQNVDDIRIFYSGTPKGQVDLVPVTADVEKLAAYKTLFLPGWNTMTPEIYDRLIEYVRGGGHLVLCAAQCTEHVTRSFLTEKKDFAFIHGGDLSALAGVKVGSPEGVVNTVRFVDEELYTDPGVPGLYTELSGGEALAVDQDGRPVLVENRIGDGKVWMLTLGEYWGHDALGSLRRAICLRAAEEQNCDVCLADATGEVEYHRYDCGSFERIVLLNTDWTSRENVKRVTLNIGHLNMPLRVRESRMNHVLTAQDFAVSFEVPSAVADGLTVSESGALFELQGFGTTKVQLFSLKPIAAVSVNGIPAELTGNTLTVHADESWTRCRVEVAFVQNGEPKNGVFPIQGCKLTVPAPQAKLTP